MSQSSDLTLYDRARTALAEAARVDEAAAVRDEAQRIRFYARQAKDRDLMADAAALQMRAERKLGELLMAARDAGQLGTGRPPRQTQPARREGDRTHKDQPAQSQDRVGARNGTGEEPLTRVTLAEAGIDKKLSAAAQKLARVAEADFETMVASARDKIVSGRAVTVNPGKVINGQRAIMGSRTEPPDSLDYFPTPPWATRALFEVVLPHLGLDVAAMGEVTDPACGEGHMTGVFGEYPVTPAGTDIHDYGHDGRQPPHWQGARDWLAAGVKRAEFATDWVITNPPFGDLTLPFARRSLIAARKGVALFVRQQWLEGVDRYNELFRDRPPTLYAQFAERVPLCKGRWDPEGSTATAYCWLVWVADTEPLPTFWIPPGQRKALTRPDDGARFTAHPVLPVRRREVPDVSTTDRQNALIKDSYERGRPDLKALAEETGLTVAAVRNRANRRGWGKPGNAGRPKKAGRSGARTEDPARRREGEQ